MKSASKLAGLSLAAAAATLALAGCSNGGYAGAKKMAKPTGGSKMATVKCSGINSCKGKTACATASNACAGQNSCKGKGWIKTSKSQCTAKGGKIIG